MSHLSFSRRMAGYLSAKTRLEQEKEAVLAYVIEVLALNLGNLLLTLLLGMFLGVLPGTAACIAVVALFRHTAGGAHSNSPWRCAAVTITVFPAMALTASRLSALKLAGTDILSAVAILTGLILVVKLAPVDSPSAPIISPARRKKLKVLSIYALVIVVIAIIFLRRSGWAYTGEMQLCLVLSLLWVSLILSGPGHRLMSLIDKINLSKGGDRNE